MSGPSQGGFYRVVRAVISFALGLFYRLQVVKPVGALDGPVMFVGNHPNSIIDPAMVFATTERPVTFLAREPLFRVPLFGAVLRGLGALPVYRKQDHPGLTAKNEGTLDAAATALQEGRAITIFPEGRSHSEPQLSEIKTGAARIAFRAAKAGAKVRIVPVGLTYQQKHRFRSRVRVEVGKPIEVESPGEVSGDAEALWVRGLTVQVADGLRDVTMNVQRWSDLQLIETGEQLYALRIGEQDRDPDRQRRFARGIDILSREDPQLLEQLREEVMSFRGRLGMVAADAKDLSLQYRRPELLRFVVRNLASVLVGLPLFALGLVLFCVPFMLVRVMSRTVPLSQDRVATLKFVMALALTPLWQALLCWLGFRWLGVQGAVFALCAAMPLALFTRYFLERWRAVLRDVFTFFTLGSRARLKALLLVEGERLAAKIEKVAVELKERTMTAKGARGGTASPPAGE
ncbi:MAG: 1-acyl-sn-glycerol-3-phosphate acyltransferase [Archangiaceae bacterium]|nr:1-acyl-sn-glycerol-3-phosphate acyltransferase [Archangiaceae bacterium]